MCDIQYFFSDRQRIQLNKKLNVEALVQQAIDQLWRDRNVDETTREQLMATHYEPLRQAVNEGYGIQVEWGTPNYEFLKQLQTNTAVFASFKSYASITEMAASLKDESGNLRSKEDFMKMALAVNDKYNKQHLDVQYDTAVRTARIASQWEKIQRNKKRFPNLRYMLTKAAIPDAKHLRFVGINLPADHPFWSTHYPPNRWRCQCGVEQNDDDTTDLPDNLPEIPKEFAFNAGKTGQVFDLKNSEYIKSVPTAEQPRLIKQAKTMVNEQMAAAVPYLTLYQGKKGGEVTYHPLVKDEPDFDMLTKTAISLANQGHKVQMLPNIQNQKLRDVLLPEEIAKNTKTPDYVIDGDPFEMKEVKGSGKNAYKRPFSESTGQADNLIINIGDNWPYSEDDTLSKIAGKFELPEGKRIEQLWLNYKGKWVIVK